MLLLILLGLLGIAIACIGVYYTDQALARRRGGTPQGENIQSRGSTFIVAMTAIGGLMIFGIAVGFSYLPGEDRGWEVALITGLGAVVLLLIAAIVGRRRRQRI